MTSSNERKSRAASYSLNRKVMAKIVMSSTHPVPGLDPKGHCVQTYNTKIVMNKDYFTTSCSPFRSEVKVRLEKCLAKLWYILGQEVIYLETARAESTGAGRKILSPSPKAGSGRA